jgi:RHS repeat-associated protein
VTATDDRRVVRTTLTIDGTPVPLATDGTASYQLLHAGSLTAVAQATDAAGNVGTATAMLIVLPDTRPPQVTVTATPVVVPLTQPVALTVTATDDVAVGPPALTLAGPALPLAFPLVLDAQGHTTFTPFHPGLYTATATAQDPTGNVGTGTATFTAEGVPDTAPPVVTLSGVPPTTAVGRPLTITVTATDNVGVVAQTLLVNDTPQVLDAAGRTTFTPTVLGPYILVATAQDGTGNVGTTQATFQALDASQDTAPPVVALTAPTLDATVTAPTAIRGTVQDATLVGWTLAVSPRGEERWTPLATGTTPVSDGTLGTFDPTLLVNDLYELRLSAVDANARTSTVTTVVRVTGGMKIGHLSFAIEDLTIPVVGLPITLNRVYDSRDTTPGDFGAGWRLDLQTTRVRKGRSFGTEWSQERTHATFPPSYCLGLDPLRTVTITLSDGRQEVFDLIPTTAPGARTSSEFGNLPEHCQYLAPVEFATAVYRARPGTLSTLDALADDQLWIVGGIGDTLLLLSLATDDVYDPTRFRLTTPEGLGLELEEGRGVQRMTDLNGNTLTFGPDGITHSAGSSVVFTRDGQGRITQITDPLGHTLQYTYDAMGDLVAVTDQEGHTTRYVYDATHKLVAITDPRGVTVARTLYDDAGRVVAHIDAEGHRVDCTHDIAGRQEVIRDRLGYPTVHIYDEQGNILQTIDPLGAVTTSTYDARGNLLTQTDPLGHTTIYTYDQQNNILTMTDALGYSTTSTYNARRQLLTQTDALGHTTTYTYDANGNLLTVTDPLGQTTTSTYSQLRGLLIAQTDALDHTTRFGYDAAGNLTRVTDALGHVTTLTYDTNGNVTAQSTTRTTASGAESLTMRFTYDARNRVLQTTYPDGSTTERVYNQLGKVQRSIDQLGRQTTYDYDAFGRLIQTTYPDSTTEASIYDAEGRPVTRIDRAGRRTILQYDPGGRVVQRTEADGAIQQSTYDLGGRVLQTTDPLGYSTSFIYDAVGNRLRQRDALGTETTWTYDAVRRPRTMTNAHGHTTSYLYNAVDQRTRVVSPDGTAEDMTYDALGHTLSHTDQTGMITAFTYDALGRLTHVTDALGQVTRYAYDEIGNRITYTDTNGHTTTFAYDRLGRRIARTLPLGMTETSVYDAAGNLHNHTNFNGYTTTYAYDTLNRRLRATPDARLGTAPVEWSYTATGQRATMTDASGTTVYTYDARDRLLSKATPVGTLFYTYDRAGNLLTLRSSHPNGAGADYAYDALRRLTTVTDQHVSPGTTTYHYDVVGNLILITMPNGLASQYTYDAQQRLTSLTLGVTAPWARYDYTLDATGRRLMVIELSGQTIRYGYDALSRLTSESRTGYIRAELNGTVAYDYDAVGNRLARASTLATLPSSTDTYDTNDRLTRDVYDANGNTLVSGSTQYTYDFADHLTTTDPGAVTILYDGDGQRVAQTFQGVTTHYLLDERNPTGYAQVVEELVESTVQRVYTYGRQRLSQTQASGTSFYGYDGHGSTRLLTDTQGAVSDTYDYDAFGNLLAITGTTPNVYRYAGEAYDAALGLYDNRARYLDVRTGRFWGMDTFTGRAQEPATLHKYLYGQADPVNNRDPSGQVTLSEIMSAAHTRYIALEHWIGQLSPSAYLTISRLLYWTFENQTRMEFYATLGGLAAAFLEVATNSILYNNQLVQLENNNPGVWVEKLVNANQTNFRLIDDFRDGNVTSIKTHFGGGIEGLEKKIRTEATALGNHNSDFWPINKRIDRPIPLDQVTSRTLLVPIPENHAYFLRNPAFIQMVRDVQRAHRVIVRVVPLKGWIYRP